MSPTKDALASLIGINITSFEISNFAEYPVKTRIRKSQSFRSL